MTTSDTRTVMQHALQDSAHLLALLEREAQALETNDIVVLAEINERKDTLVASLSQLSPLLGAKVSASDSRGQVNTESTRDGASLRNLWRACQAANQNNGRLVERMSNFTRRTLAIIHGQSPARGLYGRDGQETALATSRYNAHA